MMSRAFRASSKERSCDTLSVWSLRKKDDAILSKKEAHSFFMTAISQASEPERYAFERKSPAAAGGCAHLAGRVRFLGKENQVWVSFDASLSPHATPAFRIDPALARSIVSPASPPRERERARLLVGRVDAEDVRSRPKTLRSPGS
jgi:hypothetical protein